MTIDILCRVVDNYGDIGFAYRLTRAFAELPDAPRIRLIVDDLASFAKLCPQIRTDAGLQETEGLTVARWSDPGEPALSLFDRERPRLVIECYACGRPDWFEKILFDPLDPVPRHIVNLEYLTAEPWARDFHLLPSLTRSPLVRKSVFMPGFEPGTGGLLQDSAFLSLLDACADPEKRLAVRQSALAELGVATLRGAGSPGSGHDPDRLAPAFWFLIFSYEHDFSSIVGDLARYGETLASRKSVAACRVPAPVPLVALVAAGRSSASFLEAWNGAGRPFPALELPFLEQSLWDRFLVSSDFAVIRGEESFSRVALAGRPFLWQCYPFGDDGHGGQLPKVHAFLDLVRSRVAPAAFADYERLTLSFNRARPGDSALRGPPLREPAPGELLSVLGSLPPVGAGYPVPAVGTGNGLSDGFAVWSREVRNLGNLASNLVTFMRDLG